MLDVHPPHGKVQRTLAHVVACEQFGAGLDKTYAKALKVGGQGGE